MKFTIKKEKNIIGKPLIFLIIPDEDVYYYKLEFHSAFNETLIKLKKCDLLKDKTINENYLSLNSFNCFEMEKKELKDEIEKIIKKYLMIINKH